GVREDAGPRAPRLDVGIVKLLNEEELERRGAGRKGVRPRRRAARNLDVDSRLAERSRGDSGVHALAGVVHLDAANADGAQAARQAEEVLLLQPRLALVDTQYLVDRIAEEETAVEGRDLCFGERHWYAVEVGEGFHEFSPRLAATRSLRSG